TEGDPHARARRTRSARRREIVMTDVNRRVLPGFALSLGYTLLYMSLLVGIPLAAGFLKASHLSLGEFWAAVSSDRAVAAYLLTVGASFASALINAILGLLVAWVLVRYDFPLKRLFDSLVDLPFALPLGEYGSVVFISGNMPFKTEIAPVLVVARLEEFAYTEATAIAVVILAISFVTLFAINLLERWSKRHHG